jgi:hypothetical protein
MTDNNLHNSGSGYGYEFFNAGIFKNGTPAFAGVTIHLRLTESTNTVMPATCPPKPWRRRKAGIPCFLFGTSTKPQSLAHRAVFKDSFTIGEYALGKVIYRIPSLFNPRFRIQLSH